MTAISYQRGHKIIYHDNVWRYADTLDMATFERPCVRCGRMPVFGGRDVCLGNLQGVQSACCGHGVSNPFVVGLI